MQFKLIFVILNLLSALAFAEETNLFQVNYLSQSNDSLHSLQKKPDTKIYAGMNKEKDNIRMLEDGYDLMGTSAFQGPFTEPNQALKHAQSIEADVVLVYDRKINEMTRTERLRQIHAEMKKSSKSEKNSVIEVSEADLQDKNSKFDFYATYWAKLPQPILGLHVIKLIKKNSDTKEKKEEAGLKVIAVIKDSPAFKSGIQKGDVILVLNDVNTESPEEFAKSVFKQQGNKVKIKYARDNEEKVVVTELNRR
ncbi:PDZ domain-containing protein [Candidatus Methylopumilus universalis]|uniref:PDZ domain-containing protein n=1 Tax=Candidatus Methylopumilus universalis TaxID=2588536 RepID=UPI001122D2B0|nr:PDZ domain-containing protein [Candidatus Methylopumilus universalis]QDC46408.1 PDZ domain-containing protein [Candidatus Methylopumilus universalis]